MGRQSTQESAIMAWFRRRQTDNEFSEEVRAHLALETDKLVAEGWAPATAAAEARRRFGNVGRVQERYYESHRVLFWHDLRRDIRYACRTLARDKGYVAAVVGALGIGLAANIALFALFAAVALKPLPGAAPDRVVTLYQVKPPIRYGPFSVADYLFYRDNAHSLSGVAAGQPAHLRLARIFSPDGRPSSGADGGVAEPVIALFVTTNYFSTFGVRPVAGRPLIDEDDAATGESSGLLSENYWERRFNRDPTMIGSTLVVSGMRVRIVGITPRDFAGVRQEVPDVWVALSALGNLRVRAAQQTTTCCELIGRLADGVTLPQSQAELTSLAVLRRATLPKSEQQTTVTVAPAVSFGRLGDEVGPLFIALQVAMVLVLLIACANVAGFLLGRAAAREREIAVRLATGASRFRLVRQLVTEGIVVALIAGAVAGTLTIYALALASRLGSAFLSREGGGSLALHVGADSRVLLYAASMSVFAGLLFALMPALQASRPNLAAALKGGGSGADGKSTSRLRGWLIAGQIAVSAGFAIIAVGLTRSSASLVRNDPGFRADHVLAIWLTNPEELALPATRAREIEAQIRDRLRMLPGVQALAVASRVPLGGNVVTSGILPQERVGDQTAKDAAPKFPYAFVSETYFTAMRIPVLRGRTFTPEEVRDSAHVAVISQSMARALWPTGDAIGHQIALGTTPATGFAVGGPTLTGTAQVIGIVGDVRGVSMTSLDVGDLYMPGLTNDWSSRVLLRVDGDPNAVVRDIPRIVSDVEPTLPVSVQLMSEVVAADGTVTFARMAGAVFAMIGAVGLLLAAVGVCGMVSYGIRQREREIGIRAALGASRRQIAAVILRDAVTWISWGIVVGVVLGIAGIRLMNSLLAIAAVSARLFDPFSIVVAPTAIVALAIGAALFAGRGALSLDPAVVLRRD